jgi:hypothetical protein
MRRLSNEISVTSERSSEVIDGDEEDIGFLCVGKEGHAKQNEEKSGHGDLS